MTAFTIHHGDCFDILKTLPDNSVDSIVTDPPYGIRFMGKAWDGADIEKKVATRRSFKSHDPSATGAGAHNSIASEAGKYDFSAKGLLAFQLWTMEWAQEVLRVLKPGGHLIAFAAPRSFHRLVSGLEDAGFEIRDHMQWIFGSGFPKSHNLGGKWEGWGTNLKPAFEPICLARKPFDSTVAENVILHGTGALNINDCRIPTEDCLNGGAYSSNRKPSVSQWGGTINKSTGQDFIQPVGRWPANVMHDGSEEVLAAFPDTPGQQGDLKNQINQRKTKTCYGNMAPALAHFARLDSSSSAARFFYCAKASPAERHAGLGNVPAQFKHGSTLRDAENLVDRKGNHHPTVKPIALMRYLVRLITPKGGNVLDLFCGSGSTGVAAIHEGMEFIGIEREEDYVQIAQARCKHAYQGQQDLFGGAA